MTPVLHSLLVGLPVFLLHIAVALALLALALGLYLKLTPHKELALIREGNTAAAISVGGAAIGLALPMAMNLKASANVWDIVLWGLVTVIVQLVAFRVVDLILRDLPGRIARGELAAAIFLAMTKIAVALVNAAAVSG